MKYINLYATTIIALSIAFVSSFFFIGSEENIQKLIENSWMAFLARFIGFTIFGLLIFLILFAVNLVANRFSCSKVNLKKMTKNAIILISIGSLIGTSIFFYEILNAS